MAATYINIESTKTYANEANARKAVELFTNWPATLKYFISWNDQGRCFPIFIGADAIRYGVHFTFHVVG
jgi:hypothetical protein